MVTVVAELTAAVDTAAVPLLAAAGMLTLAGVVTTLASEFSSCTLIPPAGAASVKFTVICVEAPPVRWEGLAVTLATASLLPVVLVVEVPPKLPELV